MIDRKITNCASADRICSYLIRTMTLGVPESDRGSGNEGYISGNRRKCVYCGDPSMDAFIL
jgi:hypothetical protein